MMQAPSLMDIARSVIPLDAMKNRVSDRLRSVIGERGYSQAEAARKCGLSPSRLNNYLKPPPSGRTPDLDTLMRMARGLNTTTDYLLGFSAAEPPDIAALIQRLLELEGMATVRAEAIAETAQEALRVLAALPSEGDAETRSRIAAQAAWQLLGGPKPTQ